MAAALHFAFRTLEVPLFHRRETRAPLSPRGSVNECSLSNPGMGYPLGSGYRVELEISEISQAGEDLL